MKKITSALKVLLSLGLGFGLIFWFWSYMSPGDKEQTISAFGRANYFWVILAPVLGFLSNFIRTQRWRLMLRPLGYHTNYWNTFFSVMIMYFFNMFVPRLGEVTRCTILAEYENVPVEKSIGTMVTERLIDVICLFIIGGIIFLFIGGKLFEMYANFKALAAGFQAGGNAFSTLLKNSIPILLILAVILFSIYVTKKHGHRKLIEIVKEKTNNLFQSILSVRNVQEKSQFILLTNALWLTYLIMFYVVYKALPETADLSILSALACLFFGSFAMVITPGGIGIFPIVVQAVLILYGIDKNIALAVGMISWAVQTLGILLGGMVSLILINLLNKKEDAALVKK